MVGSMLKKPTLRQWLTTEQGSSAAGPQTSNYASSLVVNVKQLMLRQWPTTEQGSSAAGPQTSNYASSPVVDVEQPMLRQWPKTEQGRGCPSIIHPYWPMGASQELQQFRLQFPQSSFLPSHKVFCVVQLIGLDNIG
ncbi:hypothetical protein EJ02DRAFT_258168 [Clathrospora elynae]|uniref:Uncharacterized protein n=1 Tax=Clathrospora elynae TaxID=706981 RepID=A0A6A5SFB2_9PLEO|nr:hypothetical protein EJ02DRAFT_258168 [Clathrospora elynae]